ncbi:MAG: phasin family protein [Candidatus Helarchaeota archaeon]
MKDLFKKSVLFSLGLATLTKEKIEKAVKKAGFSSKEGKKLVNDLMAQSKKAQAHMEKMINQQLKKAIKAMKIATLDDLKKLEKKLKKKK